jgi:hypothetical protein
LIKWQASTVERATIAALVRMVGQHSTANLPDYASLTKLNNMTGSTGAASVAYWDYGYNGRLIIGLNLLHVPYDAKCFIT